MRTGSLFSGYSGLDLGVNSVIGSQTAWFVEWEKAPSAILAHHYPDVPNYHDVTKVDWDAVEPVDVLTGGFPCQDVSHAGKRLGLKPGTRSGLWAHMAYAIDKLRPALVVAENVRGLLSAEAGSDLEPCAWCVGDGAGSPLRALGAVLGDLADLGYDAQWHGVRAADVGAPHERFRVFVFAWPARNAPGDNLGDDRVPRGRRARRDAGTPRKHGGAFADPGGVGRGAGRGATGGKTGRVGAPSDAPGRDLLPPVDWGAYADAIAGWEHLTRPAPAPTKPGKTGQPRLSPAFVEWMMGLPAGHVTDVPGVSRNDQLKALGNGVVPAQAAHATRLFLAARHDEAAA